MPPTPNEDFAVQRQFRRERVDIAAHLSCKRLITTATIIDLSEGGLGVFTPEPLTEDTEVFVSFELPSSGSIVRCVGKIVWSSGTGRAGMQITAIDEPDKRALTHWLTRQSEA
ncbi:MAG TPA: PilZ domain-containing protein [Clostridia bacterium]|nr:PilZ domain-containing protein [Clostridia bacterium]